MNVEEISRMIREHFPSNSDAFQDAWLHLLETDRNDMHQLYRSIKKAKNRKILEYFRKKKEISQFAEHGENMLDRYGVPTEFDRNNDESIFTVGSDFYKQVAIYFLKEFLLEKQKNWEHRKELGINKLKNSQKWQELRQRQLNIKSEIFVERQKRLELMREFSYKKLENSRRWRKLRQEQLNKKFEMFEKKYETHKKRIELDMYKLVEVRSRARSWGNTLHRRLEKIEESLKLQQSVISKITAKNKFRAIDM
ncbi:MAG TPA: hypothetical protein DDY17_04115 [Syntrophaceae bacterium]|jgi:hypothetical protein|nr:hypothetical protein [Syntrophaceae bacterium]